VGGGKDEPSPIKILGGRMGDLDRTGDKYTCGPRKIESSPKYIKVGMGGYAHEGKDAVMEGGSSEYSSSVKKFIL